MKLLVATFLMLAFQFQSKSQDTLSHDYMGLTVGTHSTMGDYYILAGEDTVDYHFEQFRSVVLGYQWELQRNKRWSLVLGLEGVNFAESLKVGDSTQLALNGQGLMTTLKGRFYYFRRPKFQLYSGAGLNASHYWIHRSRTELPSNVTSNVINVTRTGFELELIGLRYHLAKNWALQFALSTGYVPFRLGVNYRLNSSNSFFHAKERKKTQIECHTGKGAIQVSYSIGKMYGGSESSGGISSNVWWEKFVKDQFSLGLYAHVSRGVYFMDDFSSLSNGYGIGRLTKNERYKETQVHNFQLSFRATKYVVVSPRFNFIFGAGAGLRARILPNGQMTSSGGSIIPIALNAYYGFRFQVTPQCNFNVMSGFIPNLLQIGLGFTPN
jgi:hypothetical protein